MGRRSQHTLEELRELILAAARQGVEGGNGQRPSAREIARAIGYAPGTLYNAFNNLDEIMLHVEAAMLAELDDVLANALSGRKGLDALRHFAASYVEFAYENQQLWRLMQEHHPEDGKCGPDWYLERLYAPITKLEQLIAKGYGVRDADELARSARLIWSAIHGIVLVATTAKFGALPVATTVRMAEEMMESYASNISSSSGDRRASSGHGDVSKRA